MHHSFVLQTNGLDSAVAFKVLAHLVHWAHHTRGVLVAALQQPTPETLALFDDVLLLAEGRVLFHGPVGALEGYLASLGFVRPGYAELAEWALEVLCNPTGAGAISVENRFEQPESGSAAGFPEGAAAGSPSDGAAAAVLPFLFTPAELAAHWSASASAQHATAPPLMTGGVKLTTPYASAQYGTTRAPSATLAQLRHVFAREALVTKRNWVYIGARLMLCGMMVRCAACC